MIFSIDRRCVLLLAAASLLGCGKKMTTTHALDMASPKVVFGELGRALLSTVTIPPPQVQPHDGTTSFGTLQPRGIEVGDLDGDGFLDLFLAPSLYSTLPEQPVLVLLNGRDGTFHDGTSSVIAAPIPTAGMPNRVFIADLNGDGRNDVLEMNQGIEWPQPVPGGRNLLLASQADGKLHDVSSTLPPSYTAFNHPGSMTDVNQDGCADFVDTQLGRPVVATAGTYFLLGDCHGGFTKSIAGLPPEIAERPCCSVPMDPTLNYQSTGSNGAADLDGDGAVDLVTGSYRGDDWAMGMATAPQTLRIYRNDTGSFVEKTRLSFPAQIVSEGNALEGINPGIAGIVTGDLDGDGLPEVLVFFEVQEGGWLAIYHNDGAFQFHDITVDAIGSYDLDFLTPGGGILWPPRLILRDVDHDGHLDLVLPYYGTSPDQLVGGKSCVYRGDGKGHLAPFRPTLHGTPATANQISALMPANAPASALYGQPLVFDVNHDGVDDLVILSQDPVTVPSTQPVNLYLVTILSAAP